MKTCKSVAIVLLLCVLAVACKKSRQVSVGNPLLATADVSHAGGVLHYRFVYTAAGQVDSMILVGGGADTGTYSYHVFTYSQQSYTVTDGQGNSFAVVDSDGFLEEVVTYDTLLFTYTAGSNLLYTYTEKEPSPNYPYYVTYTYDVNWTGGDVSAITVNTSQGSTQETYAYNTSRAGQVGDGIRIDDFLTYGLPLFTTANVPSQLSVNGAWLANYFYEFDNAGRISQMIKVVNSNGVGVDDTTVYHYTYR